MKSVTLGDALNLSAGSSFVSDEGVALEDVFKFEVTLRSDDSCDGAAVG